MLGGELLACSFAGSPSRVAQGLQEFIQRTRADELIISSMIFDHQARLRSYELTAEVQRRLAA